MGEDLSTRHRRVLTASESTPGVDAIDINGNLTTDRVYHSLTDLTIGGNVTLKPRPVTRGAASTVDAVPLRRNMSVSAGGYFTAGRNPGVDNAPYFRDFLIAAGMLETPNGGTDTTYTRSTTWTAPTSLYDYMRHLDDYTFRLVRALGVRGNLTGEFPAGELATWKFDGASTNFPYEPTEGPFTNAPYMYSADLPYFDANGLIDLDQFGDPAVYTGTESYDESAAMCVESSTVTFGANSFAVTSWKFDLGWTVEERARTRASPVVEEVVLISSEDGVTLEITLDDTGLDWEDVIQAALDATTFNVVTVLTDGQGSGGSTLTITCPRLQVDWVTLTDSAGLASWTVPAFARGDYAASILGDNEISFVWSVTP